MSEKEVIQDRGHGPVFQPSFPGQKDVFLPDIEVPLHLEPMDRERLAELLSINLADPAGTSTLCNDQECTPPFGDKDDCELYVDGRCAALDHIKQLIVEE